jgi:hypothetical protein
LLFKPVSLHNPGMSSESEASHVSQSPVRRSFWSRNWKWLVPLLIVSFLLALAAFAFGIYFLIMSVFKSSDVYQEAMQRVQSQTELLARLGEPVETGWWMSGQINVSGPSGQASLAIPLKGPKGKGTLYIEAEKRAGQWQYSLLEFEHSDQTRFSLLVPATNSESQDFY